ncbi:ribonuclease J [Dinoroseobacter sp. S76]|uniref:ribonuclease J n=1 Tax=Dinoroseobacter sp. S76 TaxID=3415124 RepID=UPI003C7A78AA
MAERLIYLPLGGAGEIGMNAYVYGYGEAGRERLILVDIGVAFPDMDSTPGVDLITADVSWLAERADQLEAIFITHAHEDHVGGLGLLHPRLKAPVYARPFTGAIAQRKMDEKGLDPEEVRIVGAYPEVIEAGPFKVSYLPVSHSIPEAAGLVIDSPAGRVIHTGDFKLDPTPIVGEAFDPGLWGDISKDGVLALVCDSTNVFSPKPGRSEADVAPELKPLVAEAGGMVVATTFASNIARLQSLAEAGREAGRSVVLLGRAMKRMVTAGVESGVLTDFPPTVAPEAASEIPRENLMLIVTGSQGERRAASAQLARGKYLGFELAEGDLFVFSSKTIPGNEKGVARIMNALSEKGVDLVDDEGGRYHVSGHANRPDLLELHRIVNPKLVVPMHGEHRHLRAHARLAEGNGRTGILAPNGSMVVLSGNKPGVAEYVETGRTYLDGSVLVGAFDGVVRDRIKLALNGHVVVAIIIDEGDDPIEDAWAELRGLPEIGASKADMQELVEYEVGQTLIRANRKTLDDDAKLDEAVTRAVRHICQTELGRRPEVTVLISRLMAE